MTMTEEEKIENLRKLVDRTAEDIQSGDLTEEKARELIAKTREEAEDLIPDDMEKYDMIYGARFERLIDQFIKAKQE
ncbi:MAG TPA: hypothetical protein ENO22_12125 [candidate division Zixibacteria bacterium]|nr:hypothetical protein [candidate division Zixibacteria bacterium]HER00077.1 hypothetical protein [candidate division Zixibacteria bacterium]